MAENVEETVEVHVEDSLLEDVKDKTEKKKLDRNFTKKGDVIRKRRKYEANYLKLYML